MDDKKQHFPSRNASQTGSYAIGRFIQQLRKLERHPRTFGDGGALTPSEIHTIDAIGTEGSLLMSELAKRMGVTKGAVTQVITRLQAKELVERVHDPEDFRVVLVSLTEKGRSAYLAHQQLHESFYKELYAQFDQKEIEIFEACLDKLVAHLQP
ncbi:MarR family transcriptional regulator [Brevibacillus centrosporus]|uniref:MarR family winged helix-turn-helix transcriptional regulator n=1 Tax=Brevibacillus centrosporus TaxID=54910 RepID=UPI002E20EB3A|nr:MarR family transcriptional regulator [Brevibacillus centrosporus]